VASSLIGKARSFARSVLNLPQPWERATFLGREYRVRRGAIRTSPDYDDAWLLQCARHAENVFDLGSNVGQAALIMLQNPGLKRLILVDPNPDALSQAAENLIHSHLADKVGFVCAFIGDKNDQAIRLWTVGTGAAGSMYAGHAKTASRRKCSLVVPMTTADALAERLGLFPDFMKIDVEGAEALVLEGARMLAGRRKPRILVEMHNPPELPMLENASRVLAWCESVSYAAWYLKEKTLLRDPREIAHRGRCHLLLQRQDEAFPEWLKDIPQGAPCDLGPGARSGAP
jgi:FkbM family methyltransferase